jgi:hypothetical protein
MILVAVHMGAQANNQKISHGFVHLFCEHDSGPVLGAAVARVVGVFDEPQCAVLVHHKVYSHEVKAWKFKRGALVEV